MLKKIRNQPFINKKIRELILKSKKSIQYIIPKWRLYGNIELCFENIDFKMYSECDDLMLEELIYDNNFIEKYDLKLFLGICKENSVVFDIGANTGIYSILSAKKNKSIKVYSFEPNPINSNRLIKNIHLNNLSNVLFFPFAVGNTNSRIHFTVPKNNQISYVSSAVESFSKSFYNGELEWEQIEVEQVTLDNFCEINKIEKLDLIKIDVEGYEINVLSGSKIVFEKFKPIILIESFINEDKKSYLKNFIQQFQYEVYLILSEGIVKTNSFDIKNGFNFLLIPTKLDITFIPFDQIENRIKSP